MKRSPYIEEMRVECGQAFDHYIRTDSSGARPLPESARNAFAARGWITDPPPCTHPVEPAGTVLDPFAGSGTTLRVAVNLGRNAIGIELNPEYVKMAEHRIAGEMPLFAQNTPPGEA
jgi:tRNA/tmRNA/rRNA uracil-C5-methylase (TrmA/RlmC/RlmD family)